MTDNFQEKRKEYRLPFFEKAIFTDGTRSLTANASNMSRGGLFLSTLDLFPIETTGHVAFCFPYQTHSVCLKVKVVHLVFDKQRCDVECGMGLFFLDVSDSLRSLLNLHILNEQTSYLELKRLLAVPRPDFTEIRKHLKAIPHLQGLDLLALRYRVNRVCTLFEPNITTDDLVQKNAAAA